ncbi:MAG: hypothetical protein N2049_07825 [Anaerolineales bacterium]|nr:hypothetical protein [Anaerolineales bacterium]
MKQSLQLGAFMQEFFDDPIVAAKVSEVGEVIQTARSLRLSEIAAKMRGSSAAG